MSLRRLSSLPPPPDNDTPSLPWKSVESSRLRTIEKIDNFQGHPAPLVRFQSSFSGPCLGEPFANFIMDLDERKQWDVQIDQVYEIHPLYDLDAANIAMGFGKFGDCSRLGVGYCQTKANLGISPREQLTLCGIQNFQDGSTIIWGTELEDWHNYMLPEVEGTRPQRAKSHIFSTTLRPTGEDSFDVEYVLQLECGGKLPSWLTTPIVIDSVKRLFGHAQKYYDGSDGRLATYLAEHAKRDNLVDRHALLMTP